MEAFVQQVNFYTDHGYSVSTVYLETGEVFLFWSLVRSDVLRDSRIYNNVLHGNSAWI